MFIRDGPWSVVRCQLYLWLQPVDDVERTTDN
jgi:hypothetical protein